MKQSKKISGIVVFAVVFLLTTVSYGYAVHYVLYAAEKHAVDDKQNESQATNGEYATRILSIGRDTRAVRDSLKESFFTEEKLVHVFDMFESISNASGAKISVQTIQTLPTSDPLVRVNHNAAGDFVKVTPETIVSRNSLTSGVLLDVSVTGPEDAIYTAIEHIESIPFVSKVNEVRITPNQQGAGIVARVVYSLTVLKSTNK